MILHKNYF